MRPLRHQIQLRWRRADDDGGAVRRQSKQAGGRPAGHLQARRLVCERGLSRSALRAQRRRGAGLARRSDGRFRAHAPRQWRRLWRCRSDDLARGGEQHEFVRPRRRRAVRPQSCLLLRRWRLRHQRPAARPHRRYAHLRRRLCQDQPGGGGARSRFPRLQRPALRYSRRRDGVRSQLCGANRALVGRAARPAIHLASERRAEVRTILR